MVMAYLSQNDTSNVLIVEREQVTMSGGECDKIGTSYRAFQTQGSACNVPVDSCLTSQIKDVINQDAARTDPLNMFRRYRERDGLELRGGSVSKSIKNS
jgi:hypothetical protein